MLFAKTPHIPLVKFFYPLPPDTDSPRPYSLIVPNFALIVTYVSRIEEWIPHFILPALE